jgi:membrane protease YdiL (CAAX protease family)
MILKNLWAWACALLVIALYFGAWMKLAPWIAGGIAVFAGLYYRWKRRNGD